MNDNFYQRDGKIMWQIPIYLNTMEIMYIDYVRSRESQIFQYDLLK